jgi:hypothetical protein
MYLRQLCMAFALFAAVGAPAAVVYKWTDSDGVVHYSDQPQPGAERVVTSSNTSNGVGPGGTSARGGSGGGAQKPPAKSGTSMSIETPAPEQVFFGEEIVPVRLHLEPALTERQTITWRLNGAVLADQPADAEAFNLQNLNRGSYQLTATLADAVSGDTQTTQSVTFYVRQPSELAPQHKKP